MDAHDTMKHPGRKLLVHTVLATAVIVLAVALLVYMIRVEDELGAVPLLLLVSGITWLIIARVRLRR